MRLLFLIAIIFLSGCNHKAIKKPVIEVDTVIVNHPIVSPDTGKPPIVIPIPLKPPIQQVVIRDTVYFDFDSDKIRADQLKKLGGVFVNAKTCRIASLRLVGGASPEGPELYNYRLSLRRAEAVKQFMVGLKSVKFYIEGNGETDLVSADSVEWWRDRNCIITVK
jgi:outer membrane protein OmpA-like peptidoglycan-associated protein